MVIKKYKVENNLAVPVNPYPLFNNSNDCTNDKQSNDENWNNYNEFAKAHTFHTSAHDGVYDADKMEIIETWFDFGERRYDAERPHYARNMGFKIHLFLRVKELPIPKMETTELPSPEKGVKTKDTQLRDIDVLQLEKGVKTAEEIQALGDSMYATAKYSELEDKGLHPYDIGFKFGHEAQPANNDYAVKESYNNGWINISNPPKKDGVYLVWGSAYADTPRQVLRCNYYKKVFKSDNCAGVKTKNITHWMPLPSPPTIKPIKL